MKLLLIASYREINRTGGFDFDTSHFPATPSFSLKFRALNGRGWKKGVWFKIPREQRIKHSVKGIIHKFSLKKGKEKQGEEEERERGGGNKRDPPPLLQLAPWKTMI